MPDSGSPRRPAAGQIQLKSMPFPGPPDMSHRAICRWLLPALCLEVPWEATPLTKASQLSLVLGLLSQRYGLMNDGTRSWKLLWVLWIFFDSTNATTIAEHFSSVVALIMADYQLFIPPTASSYLLIWSVLLKGMFLQLILDNTWLINSGKILI